MAQWLRVGEVAARSGFSRKALRLYEARGILPARARQILAKLLIGRLTFTPRTGAAGRYYEVTGRGRLDPLLFGVVTATPGERDPGGLGRFSRALSLVGQTRAA